MTFSWIIKSIKALFKKEKLPNCNLFCLKSFIDKKMKQRKSNSGKVITTAL